MRVPLKIRPMLLSDIDSVLVLENASFPDPWPRSLYEQELRGNRFSHYRVIAPVQAQDNLPPVLGHGGYWLMGSEAHIVTIAVHPEWRGQALGEWLLLELIDEARERGAQVVTLEVRPSNRAALALYRKVGFVSIGRRKRYYPNGEDALIFGLSDLDRSSVWEPLRQELAQLNAHIGREE